MDRRDFMKYVGGTGLTLMGTEALGASFIPETTTGSVASIIDQQTLYKDCLRFNAGGTLKIVQFTDCHYKTDDVANSQLGLDTMGEVLDKEQPDFVIYTGDVVYSKGTFLGLDAVLNLSIKRNLPFAVVFGNHDDEFDHTRAELYDYIQKKKGAVMPVRVTKDAPDYIIPVKAHDSEKIAALLYCIDSHSYSQVEGVPGYDWIHHEQINWYREVSHHFTAQNGGKPLPALAFFHIAIPEFRDALTDDHNRVFGVKAEGVCSPKLNSGFFTAAKECGDIMGMFIGHDHDNDYAVMYRGVMLAYGRYSGGNTVYNDIPNGGRVIELLEGERKLKSHIRVKNDVVESALTYPESFVIQNFKKKG